ncbi:MAG: hypothetical protein WAW80_05055 [Candidatus Saccharimonadales bacterium]
MAASTDITIKATDLNLTGGDTIQANDIQSLLGTVYMVAGMVAIVVIVIGGVRYVTSGGEASNIKAAKDSILYAVIGLIVVIMASAITNFVLSNVGK